MGKEFTIDEVIDNLQEMASIYDGIVQELLSDIEQLTEENTKLKEEKKKAEKERDDAKQKSIEKDEMISKKIEEIAGLKQAKPQTEASINNDIIALRKEIRVLLKAESSVEKNTETDDTADKGNQDDGVESTKSGESQHPQGLYEEFYEE